MIIKDFLADFIALFYPELCLGCSEPLPRGVQHICVKCRYDLPKTGNHKRQIESLTEKFQNIVSIRYLFAYSYFEKGSKFQKIIHQLKYQNKPELGTMLGRWYAHELKVDIPELSFDEIIPVPLHSSKLRYRGYNQSDHICYGLNEVFESSALTKALVRVKRNSSLTTLGKIDRIKALRGTYAVSDSFGDRLKSKDLLLVDDILTTGSTLIACHELLSRYQPNSISFLVLGAAQ